MPSPTVGRRANLAAFFCRSDRPGSVRAHPFDVRAQGTQAAHEPANASTDFRHNIPSRRPCWCPESELVAQRILRGPRVIDATTDRYCDACGSALLHHCAGALPLGCLAVVPDDKVCDASGRWCPGGRRQS